MNLRTMTVERPVAAPPDPPRAEVAFSLPAPGRAPHGAAEIVSVQAVLERGKRAERILRRLTHAAESGPVCLHPRDLAGGRRGVRDWARFCASLQSALQRRGVRLSGLATCIHSHHLPLAAFFSATEAIFGPTDRFVFLDSLQMQGHRNARVARITDDNWAWLWRERRSENPPLPVYGGLVKSACPLLADEVAITVAPGPGLLCPDHSAWLPVRFDLSLLCDPRGAIDDSVLESAVELALTEAEALFDRLEWPGRRRQVDARLNRRIAMIVTGIGDLVARAGRDPADLDCLHAMQRLIATVRKTLNGTSARLAREAGEVPALSRACPPEAWLGGSHGQAWRSCFDAARRDSTIRHRNLLAMSPYSVLPSISRPLPGYIDLLPLIGAADAWVFAGVPRFPGWNVTQFGNFHRRARAVIQASQGVARIAAGV